MKSSNAVATQIANLPSLTLPVLWQLWDQHFPRRPIKTNRHYLEARLAYKLQADAYGALSDATHRQLIAIGARCSKIKGRNAPARDRYLVPGTVLLREWGERTHRVTVTPEGLFDYEGQTFKSLSAVARHITGTQWSGPMFFGLKKESV